MNRGVRQGPMLFCLGEAREERMDQGELELLAATLPNDLARYVVEDNEAFQKEIVEFYV